MWSDLSDDVRTYVCDQVMRDPWQSDPWQWMKITYYFDGSDEERETSLPHFRGLLLVDDSAHVTMHPSDYRTWETAAVDEFVDPSTLLAEMYKPILVRHGDRVAIRDINEDEDYPIYSYGHVVERGPVVSLISREFALKCKQTFKTLKVPKRWIADDTASDRWELHVTTRDNELLKPEERTAEIGTCVSVHL